ncbi:sensor histidine kinase [Roseicella aerolata]|uniref:histidine kinase n=1 Tax=Roseicella aerolata TaxID=2883479 RepID=A0A9X1LDK5_9PROT|nr:sensor histidine kinase [Roseicella aerolata]
MVGTDGRITFANRAALARLGPGAAGAARDLIALSPGTEAAAGLRAYLRRCSGTRSSLLGVVELLGADGQVSRFRSHGGLLEAARDGSSARVLLRLSDSGDERFSALAQKVHDLNEENRKRRRIQALLEEALRDRDILLRELHHRVKNNIHMLAGMLSAARRESIVPEAASVLQDASRRLAAVGAVHQMLYLGNNFRGVRGDEFVIRIGGMIMAGAGAAERLSVMAEPLEIPNDAAAPLALILNELLANALKYGVRADGTPGRIHLNLSAAISVIELAVEDEGPGFDFAAGAGKRASGLGLVRGLARQIGGSFTVERSPSGGARCVIRFQDRGRVATGNIQG